MAEFLGSCREASFIPYAAITISYDEYEFKVQEALKPFGINVLSIHRAGNPIEAVLNAKAIIIGGGNTFRLLHLIQSQNLTEVIQKKVRSGTPYVGWSAGSNVAGISIKTTNDMPVDEPESFNALKLVPFQINPHFTHEVLPNHNGETRMQRLSEFTLLNPEIPVIGLREGTWMTVENGIYRYFGDSDYLFMKGNKTELTKDSIIKLL